MTITRIKRALLYHILPMGLLVYFGLGTLLFFFQRDFIYHPSDQDFAQCPTLPPGTEVVSYGEADTRAYYHAAGETLVVLYHGNAGSACDRAWFANEFFAPAGASFLIIEYTGYSADGQEPSADAIRANVRDTVNEVRTFEPERVLLLGQSLGAAAAAYHASIAPAEEVHGLFLTTPFSSFTAVAEDQYPMYPIRWMLFERFPTDTYLSGISAPTTLVAGAADTTAPPQHAARLYEVSPSPDKELFIIENARHNDIYRSPEWQAAVRAFIRTDAPAR